MVTIIFEELEKKRKEKSTKKFCNQAAERAENKYTGRSSDTPQKENSYHLQNKKKALNRRNYIFKKLTSRSLFMGSNSLPLLG